MKKTKCQVVHQVRLQNTAEGEVAPKVRRLSAWEMASTRAHSHRVMQCKALLARTAERETARQQRHAAQNQMCGGCPLPVRESPHEHTLLCSWQSRTTHRCAETCKHPHFSLCHNSCPAPCATYRHWENEFSNSQSFLVAMQKAPHVAGDCRCQF